MHNNQRECPVKPCLSLPVPSESAVSIASASRSTPAQLTTVACTWPTLFCTHTSISIPRRKLHNIPKAGADSLFSYSGNICISHSLALHEPRVRSARRVRGSPPTTSWPTDQTKSSSLHLAETSPTPHYFPHFESNSINLRLRGPRFCLSVDIITATWRKSAFWKWQILASLATLGPSATIRPRTVRKRRWPVL